MILDTRSYNKKETKGRLVRKQYAPRYSKKEMEAIEASGEFSSSTIAQMKRQKKVIYHYPPTPKEEKKEGDTEI